jgi:calcineurin-like phosphoesterase family protein
MKNIKIDIIDKLTPDVIEDMSRIWFTADYHFDHPKIVDICNRPIYVSLDKNDTDYKIEINKAHNEWLIKEVHNKYVQRGDTVYFLGDVSMKNKILTEKLIDRLNGNYKFLILGNHDKNIEHSTRFIQISQIKDFTYSKFELNIHIVLCHYCMLSYNRQIHGSWHLFGHSHCRPLDGQPNLSFDVGIDRIGFWRPYNLYEICKIMNGKQLGYNEDSILKML